MRLTIESLVHGGRGLARADGVVFVPFVLPGEVVEAEIVEKRKGFSIARLTEVLEPSPRRVEPPCPYFGRCGGCQWQHAAYDAQVEYKQAILRETLRRTGKVEPEFLPPLSGGPHGYRRRASFQTGPDGSLGFFGEHSHTLVPVDRCLLLDGPLNTLLPALAGCRGWLSGLSAIEATSGQEGVLLGLFGDPPKRSVLEALVEELPGVAGAVHVRSGAFAGARSVSIPAGEVELTVSAGSFFQANAALNARLVEAAADSLGPLEGKAVLDAYAGGGNFAFALARRAGSVTAVESVPSSAADAKATRRRLGLESVRIVRSAFERASLRGPFDAAVVDPPRTGLTPKALAQLLALAPRKLAYVSCDPATLARDLNALSSRYAVRSVRLADMFPQTAHIEAVAALEKA
jgi:23S rRNA (uracil1939-C5)-methyltransferase